MAKYIARRAALGFGKETVRGTSVTIAKWINKTDCSFDDKTTYVKDEGSISSIRGAKKNYLVNKWAEGDISMHADVNSLGWLLLGLIGAPASVVATGSAYQHTFSLVETNQTQSLTLGVSDPTMGDLTFANCVIDSLTISVNAAEIVNITATVKGQAGATTTHTVTYAADYKLLARHATFKTATNLAGLGAASATKIRAFEVTIKKNTEQDMSIGSGVPDDFVNLQFEVSGSITALFDTTTLRDYNLAGTDRAMRFQIIDTTTTIGSSSNPTLTIDFPLLSFTEYSRNQGNNELVLQTLTFEPVRSFADASGISIVLINTTSAY